MKYNIDSVKKYLRQFLYGTNLKKIRFIFESLLLIFKLLNEKLY